MRYDVLKDLGLGAGVLYGVLKSNELYKRINEIQKKLDNTVPEAQVIIKRVGEEAWAIDNETKQVIAHSKNHASVIQKAVDEVGNIGGGIVYIKTGLYNITDPIVHDIKARVWIRGDGASWYNCGVGTTLKATEEIDSIIDIRQQFGMVSDLMIEGNALSNYGVKIGGADTMMLRVLIHNTKLSGLYIYANWNHWIEDSWIESINGGNGSGIDIVTGGEGLTFIGKIHFYKVYDAIRIFNADRVTIFANELYEGSRFIRFMPNYSNKMINVKGNFAKKISDVFIEFSGNTSDVNILNNIIDGEGIAQHFIRVVNTATLNGIRVEGNIIRNVVSEIFSDPNNVLMKGINIIDGKPTKNSGVATLSAGSTSVTVSHGLAGTPTKVLVTPYGNARVWVENITDTSFDIVTDTAPSSDIQVAWYAEV